MAMRAIHLRRLFTALLAATLVGLASTGCRSKVPEKGAKHTDDGAVPADQSGTAASGAGSAVDPRYQQSFAEATRKEPPEDWRPPERTINGLSVGKLYMQAKEAWDVTRIVSPGGKLLCCTATLETDRGVIEITLRPDWAPNHVRNFMSLARLGYYDGLVFERVVREQSEVKPEEKLEMIEGGCPLGTGETVSGSIGYWLLPEFDPKLIHEEGTVGAPHDLEPDTAGTRFYITLSKAPVLDGNFTVFGKVTRGLDIARTLFAEPAMPDEGGLSGTYRPIKPAVIRKVTIQTKEADGPTLTAR